MNKLGKVFRKISSKLEFFAIPNLTLLLVAGSGTFYLLGLPNRQFLSSLPLIPMKVYQGEVWRLLTFLIYPLDMHPIFAFFTYYIFYIMGSALEAEWGESKFTRYVFLAAFITILFSLAHPAFSVANGYIAS